MTKPIAIAVFSGPYGGEDRCAVRKTADGFTFKAPHYAQMTRSSVDAARAKAERMFGFVRWEA